MTQGYISIHSHFSFSVQLYKTDRNENQMAENFPIDISFQIYRVMYNISMRTCFYVFRIHEEYELFANHAIATSRLIQITKFTSDNYYNIHKNYEQFSMN